MFMSRKDQDRFDSWDKKQIYEAYLIERQAREQLRLESVRLNRKLAEIRFVMKEK